MYILAQSAPFPSLNCHTLCTTRPTGKCLIRNGQNIPTLISISVTSVASLMNSLKNSPSSQWHRGQVFALLSSRPICVPLWSILEGQPCLLSPDGLWADSVPDLHTINNKSRRRVSLCAGYRLFHTVPNGQNPSVSLKACTQAKASISLWHCPLDPLCKYGLYLAILNQQREIIALDRQWTQQQRPPLHTVTPPGMRVNTLKYKIHTVHQSNNFIKSTLNRMVLEGRSDDFIEIDTEQDGLRGSQWWL